MSLCSRPSLYLLLFLDIRTETVSPAIVNGTNTTQPPSVPSLFFTMHFPTPSPLFETDSIVNIISSSIVQGKLGSLAMASFTSGKFGLGFLAHVLFLVPGLLPFTALRALVLEYVATRVGKCGLARVLNIDIVCWRPLSISRDRLRRRRRRNREGELARE